MFRIFLITLSVSLVYGTPTSEFWTNCTTDVLATGFGNVNQNDFFGMNGREKRGVFSPDAGLEFGILTFRDWSVEAGVDYIGGADYPVYFNIGAGIPEDKLFRSAPSFKCGIFNVGTHTRGRVKTNQNIVDFIVGKKFGRGTVFAAGYSGSSAMGKDTKGFMVACQYAFCPAKDSEGQEYFKWLFLGDYASGDNIIGGGGFGALYSFTREVTIMSGPIWFNSKRLGDWKWTIQINIKFPVFKGTRSVCGLKSIQIDK